MDFTKNNNINNILKESQTHSSMIVKVATSETSISSSLSSLSSELEVDKIIKTIKEKGALPLVDSSNVLVTKLGEYAKDSS
jgi:predicted lactoylglutathione lyase